MLPSNQKVNDYKWVFKVKYNPDGTIERYNARFKIQEFVQVHKIDYMEIFAPTIRCKLLRIFQAIIAMMGIIFI